MITGPDRNRRHIIVSALSLRSRRAAGGLRWPSESRALLAFVAIGRRLMRAVPGTRRSSCERHNSMRRGRTEDPRTSAHIYGIRGMGPSTSRRRRRIPSTSSCGRKLSYLRYDRSKNTDPRSLSTSTATITGPDLNRRHRVVSALSLRSRRAAAGLRRPSESRALLAFPRLSLTVVGPAPTTNVSCEMRNSMMQCRTEDLGINRRNSRNGAVHLA